MSRADPSITQRLQSLEAHLKHESPTLLSAVESYRQLDRVGYRMGLLQPSQSYTTLIPWWPLISVLGTFSAGKSTFINHYLGYPLQSSGNQAVDDKFTVICHSREGKAHVLPGLALDADPRFPFYQISEDIEQVAEGEGNRIDAYLQLKTCPSERLRGRIIIDSPGFDADAQRTSTLRITEHIIDLSDLVLVFFDARHPEPGAMQDTLEHLVAGSIRRNDSSKFLYILNQIDTTAREDNPEEVFGAWQRALSQHGLTAGRFYTIYNPDAAVPIEDEALRQRFESKRDADLEAIHKRIEQVGTERAYRIVGALESAARHIEERQVPLLEQALGRWRKMTLASDGVIAALAAAAFLFFTIRAGHWEGFRLVAPWWQKLVADQTLLISSAVLLLAVAGYLHLKVRKFAAGWVRRWLCRQSADVREQEALSGALARSTGLLRSIFMRKPAGWGRGARKRLARIVTDTDRFVQQLNDRFAEPSGEAPAAAASSAMADNTEQSRSDQEPVADGTLDTPSPRT